MPCSAIFILNLHDILTNIKKNEIIQETRHIYIKGILTAFRWHLLYMFVYLYDAVYVASHRQTGWKGIKY